VHLVFVESGFNVNARSYAAAVGPWQFMRATSQLFGLNVNQWVDERKDPEKATVAAARYLKHLYGIFGDWPLALASYNAGEGTVMRAIKHQGTNNYWELRLPKQTEEYVPQFMAALAISRDPVKYGFADVELDDPMRFDEGRAQGRRGPALGRQAGGVLVRAAQGPQPVGAHLRVARPQRHHDGAGSRGQERDHPAQPGGRRRAAERQPQRAPPRAPR
jgi:membrane-bound lytic murein transglycosylase D